MTSAALFLAAAGLGACGDDGDAASTTTTTSPPTSTTAAAEEVSTADPTAFCEAELAAEAAIAGEAPDADAKVDAMVELAPDEIRGSVEDAMANAESGAGDPAFDEPYGEVMAFLVDRCDAHEQAVTLTDDGFDGLPAEVEAGPTVISATNDGTAAHAALLLQIPEGTEADALVGLSPDELLATAPVVSGTFLAPGVGSYLAVDLEPGAYALVCPLPEEAEHAAHDDLLTVTAR
jgi:hypothetical protein